MEEYLLEKQDEGVEKSTYDNYRYAFTPFIEWAEQAGVTNMNDLTPKDLHDYKRYLQGRRDGGYASSTFEAYLTDFRAMIEHAESYGGVWPGLSELFQIPRANGDDSRKHIVIEEDRAEAVLERLKTFEYASRRHVEFALIWDCGLRRVGLRALDLEDFRPDDSEIGPHLRLVNRPETGTRLKNGDKSERLVEIRFEETAEVVRAWIDHKRPDETDEFGREPLLTTSFGRVSKDAIKRDMQRVTAPCFVEDPCEGCNQDHHNRTCPGALSPHPVRRGAITRELNRGVLPHHVSERHDVSEDVIEKHYDARTDKAKLRLRREAYTRAMKGALETDD